MIENSGSISIALAQLNPVLGDVAGNAEKARAARAEAKEKGAEIILFPELFLAGYPPEDLVKKPAFVETCRAALDALARETADGGPAMLIGLPWLEEGKLYNAIAALDEGRILGLRFKVDCPIYGVFDEKRVFDQGPMPGPLNLRGVRLGLPICEDIWGPDIVECLAETGAEMLLVPNGSPYHRGKTQTRHAIAVARAVESGLPLIYLNQVGGQDELVFDGASFGIAAAACCDKVDAGLSQESMRKEKDESGMRFHMNASCSNGALAFQMPGFCEAISVITCLKTPTGWRIEPGPLALVEEGEEADYAACALGLKDYVEKNRFPGVILGLSGGVDSALCAAIAVDALGPSRVHALMLPYRFTSEESLQDARDCAKALGIRYDILPIAKAVEGLEASLAPLFAGQPRDITEENIQSRARGTLLMSLSNKFGAMVITTGNKSEMSVGYATLYGDMNGGYNPIKDLYKMEVFRLCALRNRWKPSGALGPDGVVIPENILIKPPSAELRENQKDEDSLPPYPVLDDILECLVERDMPISAIIARGHDRAVVERIEHLLTLAEYKRRQAAPGVKVTERNFGRDRRYPITNRFRDRLAEPYAGDATLAPERQKSMGDGV